MPDLAPWALTAGLPPPPPCVVCASPARWDDAGVWRCTACWPMPLTEATRTAEAQPLAPLAQREVPPTPTPVVGPRRPPFVCPTCQKPSTWLVRKTTWVCYRCAHSLHQPKEEAA
jgi:ribosomal protein L37AE/L43A